MADSRLTNMELASTRDLVRKAKLRLLQMHYESRVGHIGGNLSALDILLGLYHFILGQDDLFVLSKGHGAGALYVTLWSIGALTDDDLREFHQDGTRLSGHPPAVGIPEIVFATGSLGHGLGLACGLALGKKLKGQPGRVFCLTSDGEWNEGSSWEALIFLTQHKLDNLVLIVDCNGLQGFGTTREVANLEPTSEKFHAFGMDVLEIDGHAIQDLLSAVNQSHSRPLAVVAKTIKGCGVSFMENRMEWHYLPMNAEQYELACKEVEQACVMSSADR
jgi:transketolase